MADRFQRRVSRTSSRRIVVLGCVLTIGLSAALLYGQTASTMGKLERGWEATCRYLNDKESGLIRILNKPLPVGPEITVTGQGLESGDSGEIYLIETNPEEPNRAQRQTFKQRQSVSMQPQDEPAKTRSPKRFSTSGAGKKARPKRLAIAGTLLLIFFLIGWRNSRRPEDARSAGVPSDVRIPWPIPAAFLGDHRSVADDPSHLTQSRTTGILPEKPIMLDRRNGTEETAEYKTTKILTGKPAVLDGWNGMEEAAQYKTTKILPGKLIVLDSRNGAEETEEIYLTDPSGMGEVEIGRDSPDATGGVRIKDPANTLSRRQARLVYSAQTGEFRLVNLTGEHSNPTIVNRRRMASNETVLLRNNDILEMGNIRLKFSQ